MIFYCGWGYLLSLCVEIYIILKFKAYSTTQERLKLYYTIVPIVSFFVALMYMELDSLGTSELYLCFILADSTGEKIGLCLNISLLFIIWISYYKIKKQLGCCYGPAFYHLSRVVLVVSISGFVCRVLEASIYLSRTHGSEVPSTIIIVGCIATLAWGVSVAIVTLLNPKIKAKIKEKLGMPLPLKEALFESDLEKQEVIRNILNMTVDGASDDLADMIEHLGHRTILQILILLTLRFREERDGEIDLEEALISRCGSKEQMHYDEVSYLRLAHDTKLLFIDQFYCADIFLVEFETDTFRCIMKAMGFDRNEMLE